MNDISIAIPSTYYKAARHEPIIKHLGNSLCKAYGLSYPRNYAFTDEPVGKLVLFRFPIAFAQRIVKPVCKFLGLPLHYAFIVNCVLCDWLFSLKMKKDESKVLYASSLLKRTIRTAKKKGKIVIVEAGNSEPIREHDRIVSEYERYGIKHRYIYGNKWLMNSCLKGFELCDEIITISKVSTNTYVSAGYPKQQLHLIPLTGTDFSVTTFDNNKDKPKAFVTTAFQNFIKGTHRLLLAWKSAGIKDIPLYVVGNLCDDMQEFIKKNSPFDGVVFTGQIPDLKGLYNSLDAVGVMLSLSEGAVRTTPEMMSYGFPMITSLDASCDLVEDNVNGYIVDPMNEQQIIEKLRYFSENWNRVHDLRQNVLDSVRHRTSKDWAVEVADYLMTKC